MSALNLSINISFFLLGGCLLTSMAGLELSSSLIMITGLIHYLKKRGKAPNIKTILFFFIPLFAFSLLSLAINGVWPAFFKTLGWYRWIFFLMASTYLLANTKSTQKMFVSGLYTGLVLSFANSMIQFFTGYDFVRGIVINYYADLTKEITRITGFFNLPTTWGYILAMFCFVPLSLFVSEKSTKRWLHGLMLFLAMTMLAMTHTRGAWLAFLSGLVIFVFFTYRRLLLPLIASVAVLAVTLFFTNKGFHERISSLMNPQYYSNLQRIELWKANFEIFKDNPLLGVGLHENDMLVVKYHEAMGHTESFQSHAHNSYLQFLAGTGTLGFLAFLGFLGSFALVALKRFAVLSAHNKILVTGLLASFTTFLVCCLFDCNFRDAEVRYSFLSYMALLLALSQSPKEKRKL